MTDMPWRVNMEPLAKLVSGDWLPCFGPFPSGNSLHGTTLQLIPVRKRTRTGIATHPLSVLQRAHENGFLGSAKLKRYLSYPPL